MLSGRHNSTVFSGGVLSMIDVDIGKVNKPPFRAEIADRHIRWKRAGGDRRTLLQLPDVVGRWVRAQPDADAVAGTPRGQVAETKGFEPSRRFPVCTLSRGVPSTTRPRLRRRVYQCGTLGNKGKMAAS